MNKAALKMLLWLSLLASGCAMETGRIDKTVDTKAEQEARLAFSKILDQKIASLNKRLMEQDLLEDQRKVAEAFLGAYKNLKKMNGSVVAHSKDYVYNLEMLLMHFENLEQRYFPDPLDRYSQMTEVTDRLETARFKIVHAYLRKNYGEVIRQSERFESEFGPAFLNPDISLLLALSLREEGMYQDALTLAEETLPNMEQHPDRFHLQILMAELYLELEEHKKAHDMYMVAGDDLKKRKALYASLKEQFLGEKEPADQAPIGSIDELDQKVDHLIQNHAYGEAKLILIKYRIRSQDPAETERLDQILYRVEQAEKSFEKKKGGREQTVRTALEKAQELIEEGKYREAISILDKMESIPEIQSERRRLRRSAVEKLVAQERNLAARHYLMAKNATDLETKKKQLKTAYDILDAILERYPESSMTNKVKSNLNIVLKEMNRLGISP